jgi:hypothetical protein
MRYSVLLFLILSSVLHAQKHDYIWIFGYDSHLGFPGIEGVIGDFNNTPPTFDHQILQINIGSSSASISDEEGNLLFYTNGCVIFNASHTLMENGEGINPGEVHNLQCNGINGYTAGHQSSLILPHPTDSYFYYLLHKRLRYVYTPEFTGITDTLFYTLIDMSLHEGLGAVVEKNRPLISQNMTYGQLTAVKHANGIDYWIITGGDQSNTYYIILLTDAGFDGPFEQSIGYNSSFHGSRGGQANFSPDGKLYVRYSVQDGIFLFDFDRENGELTNFRHIPVEDEFISGGVAVSPNSKLLYATTAQYLYQYDLTAENIAESRITIDTFDGYQSPFPTTFNYAQLGPDCKIYINSLATVNVLHVIHNPDQPGVACNFEQHAVQLPFNHLRTLPHFPNYRLGPLVEGEEPAPPCELITGVEEVDGLDPVAEITIYPNPAADYILIEPVSTLENTEAEIYIYNSFGYEVRRIQMPEGGRQVFLDTADLPSGVYTCRLRVNKAFAGAKKFIIIK